jgi:hypothetical protein
MRQQLARRFSLVLACLATGILLTLVACAGRPNFNQAALTGTLGIVISDDSTEDWATIGVKILSVSLTPQGGGPAVIVYTAPSPVPTFNLVQLNNLGDLLANADVPHGTYTAATLTLGGNPGDVTLTASADPEPGFAGTPGATVPASQIVIVNTEGTAGNMTVPVKISFNKPLVVTPHQSNALNLEFDLSHPAFIVAHVPASGPTMWAVNFGPICHDKDVDDITRLVLRHIYGTVDSVAHDNSSITIDRDFPVEPPTTPETEITSKQTLTFLADTIKGTTFNDLDANTSTVIKNFSAQADSLPKKFVRIAARYQQDGSLVAVRIWASTAFAKVWLNPEGMVLHVNTGTGVLTVSNEDGTALPITVSSRTQFFFRKPYDAAADATPIGTGAAFLTNIVRGFKVHVTVVDPLASSLVAQTVDIETAAFSGNISSPTNTGYTYTRTFHTASDNYTVGLNYVASTTPNGKDAHGNPITGYKWWVSAFPSAVDSGTNAIPDFIAATSGTVNFGGTAGTLQPFGGSYTVWGNSANPSGWSSLFTALVPSQVPLATVAANWVASANGGNFGITVPNGGTTPITVDVSSVVGAATQVYQVDRTNNIITISPQDITTSAGLSNVAANLVSGTPVRISGIPQADGSIKAYVVFYFTGTKPTS